MADIEGSGGLIGPEGQGKVSAAASKAAEGAGTPEPAPRRRKIGEGHVMGMIRLGGHEITNALQALPTSNIHPQEEMGVFGNTTPQHVNEQMGYSHQQALADAAKRGSTRADKKRRTR